ncbi:MAG: hypothetical protein ACR2OZ_08555 [Verrucomicrobiales bacterium]
MKSTYLESPTMALDDLLATARRILSTHPVGALFQRQGSTPNELLWVGPVALTPDARHLVMLSSRYSRVALAVREHADVIWTFSDGAEEAQVTFEGKAHLADTPGGFARWANHLSQSAKDCLLQYPSHTYGFTAVVTEIEKIRVSVPSHDIDVSARTPQAKPLIRQRKRGMTATKLPNRLHSHEHAA